MFERELDVVAAPGADPDDLRLDVAYQARVRSAHDLDTAAPQARARGTAADVGDPGPAAQVVDRHVAGPYHRVPLTKTT